MDVLKTEGELEVLLGTELLQKFNDFYVDVTYRKNGWADTCERCFCIVDDKLGHRRYHRRLSMYFWWLQSKNSSKTPPWEK